MLKIYLKFASCFLKIIYATLNKIYPVINIDFYECLSKNLHTIRHLGAYDDHHICMYVVANSHCSGSTAPQRSPRHGTPARKPPTFRTLPSL